MIEKSIGKRIQENRKKKGITQESLAEMVGLTTNHLSAIERGASGIRLEMLVHIINILECTADDIFCDVVDSAYINRASRISDSVSSLTPENRDKVFEVLETLIKTFS